MTTVLIADDSADMRTLMRISLTSQGWRVLEAPTPTLALALAERERPDAIVLDVVFEGQADDGLAVCRALRARPETATTPIVMLTGQTSVGPRADADTSGATAFLAKPFRPMDLVETLRALLDVRAAPPPIGLLLLEDGRLTPQRLERALAEQRRLRAQNVTARLGEILVREGAVSVEDVERALDRQRDLADASQRRVRVVIADDHLAIRDGLRGVLADEEGFEVIGVAADGADALALIRERRPDVAILDNEMPRMTGLEVMATLRAENATTAVVMFSFDSALRDSALRHGAAAFLAKDAKPKELAAAIRRAAGVDAPQTKVSVASALAASHAVWRAVSRRRRAAMVTGILAVTYAGAFLLAEPFVGATASLVAIPLVAVAGAVLGPELGAVFALGSSALTAALWGVTGHERGEAVLTIGGNGLGVIALMGIGAGFGAMRLLGARLDPRGRRVDALLESGLLMTARDPRLLEIAAEAARQTIRAEMVFLYAPGADGSLAIVAVSGAPASLVGHRETARSSAVQRAFVQGRPRALRQDEVAVLHPRARSGVAVPAAPPGEEPEGVIIALSERPRSLDASDAATLARLAPSIWLALKMATRETSLVRAPLVESAPARNAWGGRT